ncbi:MAG: hypothetical protein NXY57DRAFT_78638 [Lentinula lateritia]|nr:MAG: hypothetical protein NXY57DRAFT_78638 [Lentinula lateritia]
MSILLHNSYIFIINQPQSARAVNCVDLPVRPHSSVSSRLTCLIQPCATSSTTSEMSRRLLSVCVIFAIFIGAMSYPLSSTPYNASFGGLEQRDNPPYPGRFRNLPIKLMRKTKEGVLIKKPDTKVTADEQWILFIGPDGFHAHPGSGKSLIAEHVPAPRTPLGYMPTMQDLGEKATFPTAEERDEVFKKLLTDVPALHGGAGVSQTDLSYLNGIFAYLASVKAVSSSRPPEEWMKLYNEMHAVKGYA